MTKAPVTIKYTCVVSRETVRITQMIAILNDHEVKSGDILNVYAGTCHRKGLDHFGF